MYSTDASGAQTLISGVMIGILYALMALGITFIYSIVRMINWAMGEFYMLGSYIQYVVVAYALGRNYWWLAIIISTTGTFLIGYLLEPILIKPMHARAMERRDDYATVVTIALLLMLRSLAVAIGGPYQYRPETNLPIMWVGPLPMEGARVMASVFAPRRIGSVLSRDLQNLDRIGVARGRTEPGGGADLGRRRVPA
jgi:branched-chain amino acid transport system permease protein